MVRKVAVLGAGPTGLSAAWKLAQQNLEVDVLEKKDVVGGMSASIKRHNCTVDYGPHNFHVKKTDPSPLIRSIYDYDLQTLDRKTRMLLQDKIYTYPFRISELLLGLSPGLIFKIMVSYFGQRVKNMASRAAPDSFEAWGINNFGPVLYDLCFGDYTSKVWGRSPAKLSVKLAKQKVINKLSLAFIIKRMLGLSKHLEQFTYYQEFIYPKEGCGHYYEELAKNVTYMGGNISLNVQIEKIIMKDGKVRAICFKKDGIEREVEYDGVVSSIPLYTLINLMDPAPEEKIVQRANLLQYRALLLIYLVIDKKLITDSQLIYLLDKKFKCHRITEQKNFSPTTVPENQTIITVERGCDKNDELWNASDKELFEMVLDDVKHLEKFFTKEHIKDYFVERLDDVYPVFDLDYPTNIKQTLHYISAFENLVTTGRNGLFLNNDMHECMHLGIKGAQRMISHLRKEDEVLADCKVSPVSNR